MTSVLQERIAGGYIADQAPTTPDDTGHITPESPHTDLDKPSMRPPRSTEIDIDANNLGLSLQNKLLNDGSLMASDFGKKVEEWLALPADYNPKIPTLGDTLHNLAYAAHNSLEKPTKGGDTHQDYFNQHRYSSTIGQLDEYFAQKDAAEPGWWKRSDYTVDVKDENLNQLAPDRMRTLMAAAIRRQHDRIAEEFPGCNPRLVFAEMIHTDYVNHATNDIIHAFKADTPIEQNMISNIYLLARLEKDGPMLPKTGKPKDFGSLTYYNMLDTIILIDGLKSRIEQDKERTAALGNCAIGHTPVNLARFVMAT